MTNCFVLFCIHKSRTRHIFDPALCGIFLDKEEAKKSQSLLEDHYVSFILEFPISQTSDDWLTYAKQYLKEKLIMETSKISNNKIICSQPIQVEYKINRKKILKSA